jgi:hypothetical protein
MAYIVPRTLINQEFTQVPVFADQPLAAYIFGPQFNLYRYDVEKASTAVTHPGNSALKNAYQPDSDVTYALPGHVSGTKVDPDYTKVFIDKAEVEYFPNTLASTSGAVTRQIVPNSSKYYPNRFRATSLVFATANSVNRSVEFSLRDVAPGDYVQIRSDDANITFKSKIKALHYSSSASSLGTVTQDSGNHATVSTIVNAAVVPGGGNTSTATVANQTNVFKGGWVNGAWIGVETFTATVVTGGNLSAVRFDISSANGLIGSENTTAVALSSLTDVDELSLYTDGTNIVKLDFTGSSNFVVGDTWSVTVTAPISHTYVPTASGTYTGPKDTIYKLTVVRGGKFYNGTNGTTCARVAVTSSGTDSSATVSPQVTTNFAVGSYGISAQFAADASVYGGLVLGDVYYIPATAAAPAATNILEVYDTLPATLIAATYTDWEITSLRLVKDYELQRAIPGNDVDFNWTLNASNNTITINSGITTADDLILGNGTDPLQLDVVGGNLFVEHRDLVATNATSIGSISDPALVSTVLGTIHPDNPLAQGVYDALLNSNSVSVYFAGVATNDLEGFTTALSLARKKNLYYGLVPLTFDVTVHDAVVAHVNAMSVPEEAKWRVAWIAVPITKTSLVYDKKVNDSDWLGTLTDDPLTTDTVPAVYSLLTVAGATFVTDGVRAGDQVLINFSTTSFGKVIYDTYTVDEVRSETTLTIVDAPTAAINSAVKVQIQRVFTKDEQIDNLAAIGSGYNNRRVRAVFPETTKYAGVTKPGYFVAAALAGLRSGVVPHQGLTHTEVLGFDDLTETVLTYSEDQLNRLAAEGYFILTQEVVGATPFVRHQLTTAGDSLNTREDSITSNTDSISYGLQRVLDPYIGTWNVHRDTVSTLRSVISNELLFRQTGTYTVRAGNQLNGFTINSFKQNATFKDRVDANISLDEPFPLNNISITLVV